MPFRPSCGLLPLGAALALMSLAGLAAARPALAAAGQEFVVADDDGYGIADCMQPGSECGRVMADAWCEAHGHGHADTFGLADDVTGSTKVNASPSRPLPANALVIRCGE